MAIKVKNGNGNGHKNGNGNGNHVVLKLAVLAVAILLVAFLSWRQFQRWRGPTQVVWVAASSLAPGSLLSADDFEAARLRAGDLPAGFLDQGSDPTGQRLARGVEQGEPLTASAFSAPDDSGSVEPSPPLAELVPPGRVLVRVSVSLEDVVMHELRRGDRLDLLATTRDGRARVIASDAYLLAWVDPALLAQNRNANAANNVSAEGDERQGLLEALISSAGATSTQQQGSRISRVTRMLLALSPEDVLPVTSAQSSGAIAIALHGQKEVADGTLLSLDGRTWDIEYINGADRGRVAFVQ